MNSTSIFINDTLFCKDPAEHPVDRTYFIVSISLLSVIGVSGIIGNSLVLLVYCRSPKSLWWWCAKASRQRGKRLRPGLQHSQRRLLIALSVTDLLTTSLVLPFDIGHKVFTLLNIRLFCDVKFDNFAYGSIDNLRNIMFALEGSILTAIAIDRFLVIGSPYIQNMRIKLRKCASNVSEFQSSPTPSADLSVCNMRPKISDTISPIDGCEETLYSTVLPSQDGIELLRRPEKMIPVNVVSGRPNIRRRLCVILPITFTSLIITAFESAVFILHIKEHLQDDYSLPASRLRYFLNRLYLVSTVVSFPLVCGPYICIFFAIRNYDKMRTRLHNGKSSTPPRSRRTALTLFIATLVFYLTLLPVLIVHFGNWSTDSGSREDMARDVHMHPSSVYIHHEFYYINNAANFFIYSWVSPTFRMRLKELCRPPA